MEDNIYTLHRKRPEQSEDRMVGAGSKMDLLRQFANLPGTLRSQYSLMQGSMEWTYLEVEAMARQAGLLD
jgi:hypothetical protein